MKNIFISFCFIFLITNSGFSQKLYIKVDLGRNFSTRHDIINTNQTVHITGANQVIYSKTSDLENVEGTYGAGFTKAIHVGSMLTKNIGLEAGLLHLTNSTYSSFYSEDNTDINFNQTHKTRQNLDTYARMSVISAALLLTTNAAQFRPYTRAGIIAGKPKMFFANTLTIDGSKYNLNYEAASSKISLGFQGSVGIAYPITPKWLLFTEGTLTALSFSPEKSTLTKYEENGINYMGRLPVYHKETVYKNSVTVTTEPVSGPLTNSREELRYSSSFNALGVQLGLQYNLL